MEHGDKQIWLAADDSIVSGVDHLPLNYTLKISNADFIAIRFYPSIHQLHIQFSRSELILIRKAIDAAIQYKED